MIFFKDYSNYRQKSSMISQNYAIKYSYENFDYFGIVNDTRNDTLKVFLRPRRWDSFHIMIKTLPSLGIEIQVKKI